MLTLFYNTDKTILVCNIYIVIVVALDETVILVAIHLRNKFI